MKEPAAYQPMFRFLPERYPKLPSDALGNLLGELQLAPDGRPFDSAVIAEWDKAVGSVEQETSIGSKPQLHQRAG
jgi:hypothetical protein